MHHFTKRSNLIQGIILFAIFLSLFQCSKEDPIPLAADAGQQQTVNLMEMVTLDGSNSEGPEGFEYQWTYSGDVPESEINFQGSATANPTFIPPRGSNYFFTLIVSSGDQTSQDEVTIVASGGIELGGTLTEDLVLKNIEPNSDLFDYVVTSDLIVPSSLTLSVEDENVVVHFEQGAGLHVTDGGALTNATEIEGEGFNVKFTGDNSSGWKGIWIENGSIELNDATIENAGNANFSSLEEAGALVLSGSETDLITIDDNHFKKSLSYDLYVTDKIGGEGYFKNNTLSYKNPIKAHITFLNFVISNYPNIYPDEYEYIILMPSGKDIRDESDRYFSMFDGTYFIDGDFWSGSRVTINRSTVFMKEGSAILIEDNFNARGSEEIPTLITGIDNKQWKGIAAIKTGGNFSLEYAEIRNAGYGKIEIGDFKAEQSASFYSDNHIGSMENTLIADGGGFGYYNANTTSVEVSAKTSNASFTNLQNAGIRTNVSSVSNLFITRDPTINFDLDEGIPAILVEGDGRPVSEWKQLGEDNYYLIDAEINVGGDGFKLEEGVHMKFKAGRFLKYMGGGPIEWNGTEENPIVIEGEQDGPGSWGGLYLNSGTDGWFEIRHCTIKNGGEFLIEGATEKSCIISATSKGNNYVGLSVFRNNTISGSAGYGIVVEAGTHDFEFDDSSKNNTFMDNAQEDVLVK